MSFDEQVRVMRILEAGFAIQTGKSYEAGTERGVAVGVRLGGGVLVGLAVVVGATVLVGSEPDVRVEVGGDSLMTVGEGLRRRGDRVAG